MNITDPAVLALAAAIAMLACVNGLNAAEHRKAERTAFFFACLLMAVVLFFGWQCYRAVMG